MTTCQKLYTPGLMKINSGKRLNKFKYVRLEQFTPTAELCHTIFARFFWNEMCWWVYLKVYSWISHLHSYLVPLLGLFCSKYYLLFHLCLNSLMWVCLLNSFCPVDIAYSAPILVGLWTMEPMTGL